MTDLRAALERLVDTAFYGDQFLVGDLVMDAGPSVRAALQAARAALEAAEYHIHDYGDAAYQDIKAGRADCVDPNCPPRGFGAAVGNRRARLFAAATPEADLPDAALARLSAYLNDEGNHVGGVWGDYGQVVVDASDLWHAMTGTERTWERTSDYAATFNQMREALEACEARAAATPEADLHV